MNRRHVRAVAVFVLVLVTLTGARRSGGGGCDDHDSGSSSSSTRHDYDYDSDTTTTTTSGGSSPSTYDTSALSDVKIDTCDYDETARELNARLTITNPSATDTFSYSVTVTFQEDDGTPLGTDFVTSRVSGGQLGTETATAPHTFTEQARFQCKVSTATKYRSS